MLWKKPNPEALRQAELLRQWQTATRQTKLQLLPLHLAHWQLSRSLEATAEEKNDPTDCRQAPPRPWRRTAKKMLSASAAFVRLPTAWLSRRPCLQRYRVTLIQARRRFTIRLLAWLLRQWQRQRFHGIQKS